MKAIEDRMDRRRNHYFSFIDDKSDLKAGPHLINRIRWEEMQGRKETDPRLRIIPMQIDMPDQILHVVVFTPLRRLNKAERERIKQEIIRVYERMFSK